MHEASNIYGYFDNPSQIEPAFDPGDTAPCPACGLPVGRERVRSQSVLVPGDYRCYFLRFHIDCADDPRIDDAIHWIVDERVPTADAIIAAQGIEAASAAETVKLGSVHESPVRAANAPEHHSEHSIHSSSGRG